MDQFHLKQSPTFEKSRSQRFSTEVVSMNMDAHYTIRTCNLISQVNINVI